MAHISKQSLCVVRACFGAIAMSSIGKRSRRAFIGILCKIPIFVEDGRYS